VVKKNKVLVFGLILCMLSSLFCVQGNAATPVVPKVGAFESGVYRNLFAEMGKSEQEIAEKIEKEFQSLFHGDSNHKIMYEVGSDMAYILDVNNNDVRSEGQSYGMMQCVQLDKKTEFDKLWKWAKTYMQHTSADLKGFFAWQLRTNGTVMDRTPASDGDEYFAMALLFAAKRWGNGTGIFNYEAEAHAILDAMLHQSDDGQGYNMINKNSNQVVFCPTSGNYDFTDPSYHLPGFYELFALWGPERDRETWKKVAATSREFFKKTTNSTTGLGPDYATFEGAGYHASFSSDAHEDFRYDAWRIAQNIAFDYAWFAKDDWAKTHADRIQDFFMKQGLSNYGNCFTLSGTKTSSDHSPGLVGMNAVASLAATKSQAYDFVNELWKLSAPSGQYRYYDGCLYMFGLLHCSGNFRIWGAEQASPTPTDAKPTPTNPKPTSAKKPGDFNHDGVINMVDVMRLANAFNSVKGDARYVEEYDLNNDNAISMSDVMILAAKFNTKVPVDPTDEATPTPTKKVSTPTPTKAPTPTPTVSINPNAKLAALSFDDGPDNVKTAKVLDKLEKYKVKATFMQIGQLVNSNTQAIERRIIADGCEIGNHSWDWSSMGSMSASQIKDNINRTTAAIQQYAGVTPKFFRAPNLNYSQTLKDAVDLTFIEGINCEDWNQGIDANARAQKILNQMRPNTIILMHDVQPDPHPTPEALDIIIPRLLEQGYEFVTVSELFERRGVKLSASDNTVYTTLP